VPFLQHGDALLHEPGDVLTGASRPYQKLTPFGRRARELPVPEPALPGPARSHRGPIGCAYGREIYDRLLPERFDPDCRYVRRWVEELAGLEPAAIHRLARERSTGLGYPEPIVDHRRESARAKRL
jgi:deoxyribodipyrimidine photolyase